MNLPRRRGRGCSLCFILFCLSCFSCATVSEKKTVTSPARSSGASSRQKLVHSPESEALYQYLVSEVESVHQRPLQALKSIDKVIVITPDDPHLLMKRALLHASMGHLDRAEHDVVEIQKTDPNHEGAMLLSAKIHQAQGHLEEATGIYEKVFVSGTDSPEVVYLLMELYVSQKKFDQALVLLQKWKQREPRNPTPWFFQASLYRSFLNDARKAGEAYEKILEMDPSNLQAMEAFAELSLEQGESGYQKALKLFGKMKELVPGDNNLLLRMALMYYEHKQYREAISHLQEGAFKAPQDHRFAYYLGVVHENLKQIVEAEKYFSNIPESSSFYQDSRLHLVLIKRETEGNTKAITMMEDMIREHPEHARYYEYLSGFYQTEQNLELALNTLKKGIARCGEKEPLLFTLGVLQQMMGYDDEAIEAMQKVLRFNPDHVDALNFLGYSYAEKGIFLEEALEYVKKALSLRPQDGYITDSLGWVYFRMGDVSRAFLYVTRAYELLPDDPTIVEHLGDLYFHKGQKKQAAQYYEKAHQLMEQMNVVYESHKKQKEGIGAKLKKTNLP